MCFCACYKKKKMNKQNTVNEKEKYLNLNG